MFDWFKVTSVIPDQTKDDKKGKKAKGKSKKSKARTSSPVLDSDDSEHMLVKEVDSIKVSRLKVVAQLHDTPYAQKKE